MWKPSEASTFLYIGDNIVLWLSFYEVNHSVDSLKKPRRILTSSLSEVRLAATATLDVLSSFTDKLTCIHSVSNHIIAEHDIQ